MITINSYRWEPVQPRSQRRVHGAEFKRQVLAECRQPGASVAAVALAHRLNVYNLRQWLVGRGINRIGLAAPGTVTRDPAGANGTSVSSLQFISMEIALAPEAATGAGADRVPTKPSRKLHRAAGYHQHASPISIVGMPAMLIGTSPLQATTSSNLQPEDSYRITGAANGGRSAGQVNHYRYYLKRVNT